MNKLVFLESGITRIWDDQQNLEIEKILARKYAAYLEDERFRVEGGSDKDRVQLRVTLEKNDGSIAYPIEAVTLVERSSKESKLELGHLLLDYVDIYLQEYFSNDRDVYLPLDWSKHQCEGREIYLRGFVRNLALEAQADELFKRHGFGEHPIEPISSET